MCITSVTTFFIFVLKAGDIQRMKIASPIIMDLTNMPSVGFHSFTRENIGKTASKIQVRLKEIEDASNSRQTKE